LYRYLSKVQLICNGAVTQTLPDSLVDRAEHAQSLPMATHDTPHFSSSRDSVSVRPLADGSTKRPSSLKRPAVNPADVRAFCGRDSGSGRPRPRLLRRGVAPGFAYGIDCHRLTVTLRTRHSSSSSSTSTPEENLSIFRCRARGLTPGLGRRHEISDSWRV
jgi:hypothetical protein